MPGEMTDAQQKWVESYDAYEERIDILRTNITSGSYADPSTKDNQILRLKLLETEYAFQQHMNSGMGSTFLFPVAQSRYHVLPQRSESIGGLLYNNVGQPPIFDITVPESARASWFVELRDDFNQKASRVADFYNANVAPLIWEAVKGGLSALIDGAIGRMVPSPGNLLGVPVRVNPHTDALGTGITDEIINNQMHQKTPGKLIIDRLLGSSPDAQPRKPVDDLMKGVFLDENIAQTYSWFAQLEIDNNAKLTFSEDYSVLTLSRVDGSLQFDSSFHVGASGLDYIGAHTYLQDVDVNVIESNPAPVLNLINIGTNTSSNPLQLGYLPESGYADWVHTGYIWKDTTNWIGFDDGQDGLSYLDRTDYSSSFLAGIASDDWRPGNFSINSNWSLDTQVPGLIAGNWSDDLWSLDYMFASLGSSALMSLSSVYIDPLVLDLNGDGIKLTSFGDRIVLFDIDNDGGSREQTGWVAANTIGGQAPPTINTDGILVQDISGNGVIDNVSETLSEYYNGSVGTNGSAGSKPFSNGFLALKSLDSNGDNIFSSLDASWSSIRVWIDDNADGISFKDVNGNRSYQAGIDVSELKTFSELGITRINLNSTSQSGLTNGGNEILATGTFIINGQSREAQAANFLANPGGHEFVDQQNGTNAGTRIETEGEALEGSSYVSHALLGEVMNVAVLGVQNVYGSVGSDTLVGNSSINWLVGGAGSDIFDAGAGDDVLLIDADDLQNNIHAGSGTDIVQVIGDAGVTLNLQGAEVEIAQGGRGGDTFIAGGRTSVFVSGGDGNDILVGGAANDVLSGENGDDFVEGAGGNDLLRGHLGRDVLRGGVGDDIIEGGQDDDKLSGNDGNDALRGGQGDDEIDGGSGVDVVQFTGSFSEYRFTRTTLGVWVSDTVSGRDGTDFLTGVEKGNFLGISLLDIPTETTPGLQNPMPAKDVLVKDANNAAFDRTAAHLISKAQILTNDIDYQGDGLSITQLFDVQGGTATITAQGDVLFTPNPTYNGFMGFKYTIKDANNNAAATVTQSGSTSSAVMRAAVYLKTPDMPSDPLVTDQWYLSESNILPVWRNYTGKNVRIGQFEPGNQFAVAEELLDYRHPDLQPNIDPQWLSGTNEEELLTAPGLENTSKHATLVAGVMVAARNGEGVVGVAYDAKIAGHWIGNEELDAIELRKMAWYDIANNSWVAESNFDANFDTVPLLENAFAYAAANGRNGLGTVVVMAGGNDRQKGGNTNYQGTSNNRYSITVGAMNLTSDIGAMQFAPAPFSNPGASILVSAPGSNVTSTSVILENDNGSIFGTSNETVEGTSLAAPIVSGVVALMLEANPTLGYRDVQEILAISARKITDPSTAWQDNHASNWNGGAMHVSNDYGFGEVDALAAVRLAETWTTQQKLSNQVYLVSPLSSGTINQAITDNNATGISSTLAAPAAPMKIEYAEVTVNLTHPRAGDLIIKLVSPTGTESILMNRPGKVPGSGATDRGDTSFNGSNVLSFTFTTVRDWGETVQGNWTLKVTDAAGGDVGTLTSWSLNFFGKADIGNDNYFYTNEYAQIASTGGRNVLAADTDGGEDSINAAAASGNSTVNLTTGTASIAGTALTISTPANIENVVGGEGNDVLTGNATLNKLQGGRGNDTLNGGDNSDILWGGKGNDTLTGGTQFDVFVIDREAGAVDTITDFQAGTDRIVLSGMGSLNGASVTVTQEAAHTRISLADGQSILLQNTSAAAITANRFVSVREGLSARDFDGYNGWGVGTDLSDPEADMPIGNYIFWAGDGGESVFGNVGKDKLFGGAGNDVLVGETSSEAQTGGNDIIYGQEGDDIVFGGAADDILYGGTGRDYVDGGYGNDVIYLEGDEGLLSSSGLSLPNGGQIINNTILGNIVRTNAVFDDTHVAGKAGNDTFVVVEDTLATASDGSLKNIIYDFESTNTSEKIDLRSIRAVREFSDLNFNTVTAVVNGVSQQYLRVWLGARAVGTQYITLKGINQNQLSAGNFEFWDGILPQEVVDDPSVTAFTGNAGGNLLVGGAGADMLKGRTGDDTYIVNHGADQIEELPGGGFDTVQSSVTYSLPAEVENIVLTGTGSINATGNESANRITGNSGNNSLDGQGGSDVMAGGLGNDTYVVDQGSDLVIEQVNEGTDTVISSVSYTLNGNLENLTLVGTDFINATGNASNNVLRGNDGDNRLDGAQGVDQLFGGAGNDSYLVDANDVVTENLDEGIDTVYANSSYLLDDNIENLVLGGSAGLSGTGNAGDNTLIGNSGANTLAGGDGNDTLDGSGGADVLIGGSGNDFYVVDVHSDETTEGANGGIDTVSTAISWELRLNVENLILTGIAAVNGTGNASDNRIIGNAANNTLSGGDGADILDGGAGTDTMIGGLGADIFIVDQSTDVIIENISAGYDTIRSYISYNLSAAANVENIELLGFSNIDGTGTTSDNVLVGNAGNNVLSGGDGNDTLDGGLGVNMLIGGAGDDFYRINSSTDVIVESSNQGWDSVETSVTIAALAANVESAWMVGVETLNLTGNSLDNLLAGNGASNILDGGDGNDSMIGGRGDDTYVVNSAGDVVSEFLFGGLDTIQSSVTLTLGWYVENLVLTGANAINGTGNTQDNVLTGNSGNNSLTGDAGNDTLNGSAGVDTLAGGVGNDTYVVDSTTDTITENANEGTDTVRSSVTFSLGTNVENLVLTGTSSVNGTGNDLDNLLNGNVAANYLEGGGGNDTLIGGTGNDVYVAGSFSGWAYMSDPFTVSIDVIQEEGGDVADKLVLGGPRDYLQTLRREGDDLVLNQIYYEYNDYTQYFESVRIKNQFLSANEEIDFVEFSGGETISMSSLLNAGYMSVGTAAINDVVLGGAGNDHLYGEGEGETGADILDGKGGNDILEGGRGADTYLFGVGYGLDQVWEDTYGPPAIDRIRLVGVSAANVVIGQTGNILQISFGTTDKLSVVGWFTEKHVELIELDNSVIWDANEIENRLVVPQGTGASETIYGSSRADAINGMGGNDWLYGRAGDDTLIGGLGADRLYGEAGNDSLNGSEGDDFLFGGDGNDTLTDSSGNNQLNGEAGADTLIGGVGNDYLNGGDGVDAMSGGGGNDAYYIDNASDAVNESLNSGYDWAYVTLAQYTLPDNFETLASSYSNGFVGVGNGLDNNIYSGTGGDFLSGLGGNDFLSGYGGIDILQGGSGNDSVASGWYSAYGSVSGVTGSDLIDGGSGDDYLYGDDNNQLFIGGSGSDEFDFGGIHSWSSEDPYLTYTYTGHDVIAFNRGGGQDRLWGAATGPDHTLSIGGGGIAYQDLVLRKESDDLILDFGQGDQITFRDWYSAGSYDPNFQQPPSYKSIEYLQVVAESMAAYNAGGSDSLLDNKIETFDFSALVNAFDAAGQVSGWHLTNALLSAHLSGSNTAAIGGDLAYQYGKNGTLNGVGLTPARDVLNSVQFGSSAQTLRTLSELQQGQIRLS